MRERPASLAQERGLALCAQALPVPYGGLALPLTEGWNLWAVLAVIGAAGQASAPPYGSEVVAAQQVIPHTIWALSLTPRVISGVAEDKNRQPPLSATVGNPPGLGHVCHGRDTHKCTSVRHNLGVLAAPGCSTLSTRKRPARVRPAILQRHYADVLALTLVV